MDKKLEYHIIAKTEQAISGLQKLKQKFSTFKRGSAHAYSFLNTTIIRFFYNRFNTYIGYNAKIYPSRFSGPRKELKSYDHHPQTVF